MNKIAVIIAHEYTTRVRSKWFIIGTLLGPLAMVVMVSIPVLATLLAGDGTEGKVAVVDRSGIVAAELFAADTSLYVVDEGRSAASLNAAVKSEELQAWLEIPANVVDSGRVTLYTRGGTGIAFESRIRGDIEPVVVSARLQRAGTDTSVIRLVEQGIDVAALKITDEGVREDSSMASAFVGYGAGFIIYILIFLYGSMVMRGVVEEKANRIIEVLASSARPFDIMMGKVLGIGMVGLTQVLAWIVLGSVVLAALALAFAAGVDPSIASEAVKQAQEAQAQSPMAPMGGGMMKIGTISIPTISVPTLLLFVFYFLAGYFLYATLFAAVGSAVDQESDANQLTLPVTLPVILTMMFIGNVISAPSGMFATVTSLIPLFTPILMTVRVAATDVPAWQIALSIVLSVASFFGAVWMASRIYRIGMLSYGKKPSIAEVARWITRKV
jgi:ABC-2 type transport system permease protein